MTQTQALAWHRVTKRENLETALADGLAHAGSSLVEIVTDVDLI